MKVLLVLVSLLLSGYNNNFIEAPKYLNQAGKRCSNDFQCGVGFFCYKVNYDLYGTCVKKGY